MSGLRETTSSALTGTQITRHLPCYEESTGKHGNITRYSAGKRTAGGQTGAAPPAMNLSPPQDCGEVLGFSGPSGPQLPPLYSLPYPWHLSPSFRMIGFFPRPMHSLIHANNGALRTLPDHTLLGGEITIPYPHMGRRASHTTATTKAAHGTSERCSTRTSPHKPRSVKRHSGSSLKWTSWPFRRHTPLRGKVLLLTFPNT